MTTQSIKVLSIKNYNEIWIKSKHVSFYAANYEIKVDIRH